MRRRSRCGDAGYKIWSKSAEVLKIKGEYLISVGMAGTFEQQRIVNLAASKPASDTDFNSPLIHIRRDGHQLEVLPDIRGDNISGF